MKERKYIYLLKRVDHDRAIVILKHKLINAERIEKQLHQYFQKSRFKMTKRIKQRKWMQAHIKIGVSKDVDKRLQAVNNDFFRSGYTEWFAMHVVEQLVVQFLIIWYAYRYWLLAMVLFMIGHSYVQ